MSDYISRQVVIEEIDKWLDSVGYCTVGKGLSYYGELIGCIEDVPTADVVEVKRGKWVDREADLGYEVYQCSVCKEEYCLETGSPQENGYNFCPNCGADMRG